MNRAVLALSVAIAASVPAAAQKPRTPAAQRPRPPASAESVFKPLISRYFTAWSTRNPERAASLYAKDPDLVFFDFSGAHRGWDSYRRAKTEYFSELGSYHVTPAGDLTAKRQGNLAWTAVTFRGNQSEKGGRITPILGRHTAVWERRGTDWVIVHEQFSPTPAPVEAETLPAPGSADELAIRKLFEAYEVAWNQGNAASITDLWRPDGDILILGTGTVTRGRADIARLWEQAFGRRSATFSTTLVVRVSAVRFLGPEVATADGTFDYYASASSTGPPAAQERFTSAVTRADDRWLIAGTRVAEVPPPTPPRRR
jgi:uncharacterized protein (TIGR02246 family)